MNVTNHRILGRNFFEIFHKVLNVTTKVIADIITSEDFLSLHWEQAIEILDLITRTNGAWHTQEANRRANSYAISASSSREPR